MSNPVSIERQRARALFTLMAAGNAMMALEDFFLPEKVVPKRRLASISERLMKWHSRLCDELSGSGKLPQINARAVTDLLERFKKEIPVDGDKSARADKMRVAAFCASAWFLLDVMLSCRDVAKGKSWRLFERAVNELDLILSEACDPGEAGVDLFLKLVW